MKAALVLQPLNSFSINEPNSSRSSLPTAGCRKNRHLNPPSKWRFVYLKFQS